MAKVDTSQYQSFDDILEHLDDLVGQVRDKGTSLEHALDLLDEAIALGSKAVDLVDTAEPSATELTSGNAAGPTGESHDPKDTGDGGLGKG